MTKKQSNLSINSNVQMLQLAHSFFYNAFIIKNMYSTIFFLCNRISFKNY